MLPVASSIIQMMKLVKERSEAEPTFESRQSGSGVHTLDHYTVLVHLPCWSSLHCQLLNPCIHSASIFLSICTTTILVRPSLSRAHVSGITFFPSFQVLIADITPRWVLGLAFLPLYILSLGELPIQSILSPCSNLIPQFPFSNILPQISLTNIAWNFLTWTLFLLLCCLVSTSSISSLMKMLSLYSQSPKKPSFPPSSQCSFHPSHPCSWGPAFSTSFFVSRQYPSVVGNRGSAAKLQGLITSL